MTARHRVVPLLALAGLLACRAGTPAARPAGDSMPPADQIVSGVRTTLTDSLGVRKGLVLADSALVQQGAQRVEFVRLTATLFDAQGDQAATVSSPRGAYEVATGVLELRGGVTAMLTRGGRLTVPHLFYDARTMRFRSDSAWVFEGGGTTARGSRLAAGLALRELLRPARP